MHSYFVVNFSMLCLYMMRVECQRVDFEEGIVEFLLNLLAKKIC